MSIVSLPFFLALLISVIVYYIAPREIRRVLLLIYSLCFYLYPFGKTKLVALLVSALSIHFLSVKIYNAHNRGDKKSAKGYLYAGLIINLGLLALLKYDRFAVSNINALAGLFGSDIELKSHALVAPLGISFYTFSALSYLLDVYWQETEAQQNFGKTVLYIFFFPGLTSGPITRYNGLKDSLYSGDRPCGTDIYKAFIRLLWGLFKKLVISARAAIIVNKIYEDPENCGGLYLALAAGLFMMELYTDFSGCMDIVLGAAELYGVKLPENFRTPFFSKSVQEYWQRWHITLGGWMRDYVMYPLLRSESFRKLSGILQKIFGKKRARKLQSYIGMLVVWLLIGLWHGGEWKYILGEGLFFWAVIVLGDVFEPRFKSLIAFLEIKTDTFSWHLFCSIRVYVLVCIGNLFFRLKSMGEVVHVLKEMLSEWNPWIFVDGSLYKLGLDKPNLHVLIMSLLLLLTISFLQEKESVRERLIRQNFIFKYIVAFGLLWIVAVFGMYGPGYSAASFIYGGF